MKKLILLFALLACVGAVGDVLGEEDIHLKQWCREQNNIWDDLGICHVVQGAYFNGSSNLTIDMHERLIIKANFVIYNQGGGIITNNGAIQIEGMDTKVRNCGSFINAGTMLILGYWSNGYEGDGPRLVGVCPGEFINYEQAKIYNAGTIKNVAIWEDPPMISVFNNQGVIYNSQCLNGIIIEVSPIIGEGNITDLDQCSYLPMLSIN